MYSSIIIILFITIVFNLWFNIVEFVIVAKNGKFFGVITIEVGIQIKKFHDLILLVVYSTVIG